VSVSCKCEIQGLKTLNFTATNFSTKFSLVGFITATNELAEDKSLHVTLNISLHI